MLDFSMAYISSKTLQVSSNRMFNNRLSQIERTAAELEKVAKTLVAYDNQDLKRAILRTDTTIIDDLKQFGVSRKIHGTGYVLHHTDLCNTKYLSKGSDDSKKYTVRYLADVLDGKVQNDDLLGELQGEIKNIVLLPEWFHNYYETHKSDENMRGLHTRKDYYKAMAKILSNIEQYDFIKGFDFKSTSIHSAVKCIETLALTFPKDKKKNVISLLQEAFNELKKEIKSYFIKHTF